jgi:hypothetical protein
LKGLTKCSRDRLKRSSLIFHVTHKISLSCRPSWTWLLSSVSLTSGATRLSLGSIAWTHLNSRQTCFLKYIKTIKLSATMSRSSTTENMPISARGNLQHALWMSFWLD